MGARAPSGHQKRGADGAEGWLYFAKFSRPNAQVHKRGRMVPTEATGRGQTCAMVPLSIAGYPCNGGSQEQGHAAGAGHHGPCT